MAYIVVTYHDGVAKVHERRETAEEAIEAARNVHKKIYPGVGIGECTSINSAANLEKYGYVAIFGIGSAFRCVYAERENAEGRP